MNQIVSPNVQSVAASITDMNYSLSKHVPVTCTESFIDFDNKLVSQVRTYNQGNKLRNTKAYANGNANIYQNELKKRGGDTKQRLRQKLQMKKEATN